MATEVKSIKVDGRFIEIDGKKYRRHYYNTCVRCALSPERTGNACQEIKMT